METRETYQDEVDLNANNSCLSRLRNNNLWRKESVLEPHATPIKKNSPLIGAARGRLMLPAALGCVFFQGCATSPGAPPPPEVPPPPPRLRWGLALGGGAARGLAHVGVIEVLERAGLIPDLVVGTSAGSLVGALWASGMDAASLRRVALSFDQSALGDWAFSTRALLKGQALADFVNRHVENRPIEKFPRRFAATAVDLWSGQLMIFDKGNAGLAVRASAAVPGVFQPVQVAGREYVDGGLASPVPVRTARGMGAQRVLAVDISAKPLFQSTQSLGELLMQTITIMGEHLGSQELREADLTLRPQVTQRSAIDFSTRPEAIAEGEKAMAAELANWRKLIGRG